MVSTQLVKLLLDGRPWQFCFGNHVELRNTQSCVCSSFLSLERVTTLCSFDFWGSCRTLNCGSPSLCLHVYTTWLHELACWYVEGWLSIVRCMWEISWCIASSSGHKPIVIKFLRSYEKIRPQKGLLSHACAYQNWSSVESRSLTQSWVTCSLGVRRNAWVAKKKHEP
jgi:hypothetical protein